MGKDVDIAAILGAQLKPVSDPGTDGREQIEYIDIDRIDDDPNNFYEVSGVEDLAANIELFGLQQPIRVRTNPEDGSRVIIVSGHRRRAAIRQLVDNGRTDLREIPCIRERADGSAALQELRLIYANSDTRRMTSADISKQAERVEALLYQLKEEGYEFPGRMRDHVAEACKVSKSKLARLKVIRDNLNEIWKPSYEAGDLGESTAYSLARMDAPKQRRIYLDREKRGRTPKQLYESLVETYAKRFAAVDKLECPFGGGSCTNCAAKYDKALSLDSWSNFACGGCCDKCFDLARCKYACSKLSDKVQELKQTEKDRKRRERLEIEASERPVIASIEKLWRRFGDARAAAGQTWDACCKTMEIGSWCLGGSDGVTAKEAGREKIKANTTLPYGYNCYLSDVQRLVKIADLFGVSIDYLLCRTDEPKMVPSMAEQATGQLMICGWMPGGTFPREPGDVVAYFDLGNGNSTKQFCYFDGQGFLFRRGGESIDMEPIRWMQLPPIEEE